MENIPLEVARKFAELAPAYGVTCTSIARGTTLCLSGLIDSIYNLRSEVDVVLLWTVKRNTSNAFQPQHNASPTPPAPVVPCNFGT